MTLSLARYHLQMLASAREREMRRLRVRSEQKLIPYSFGLHGGLRAVTHCFLSLSRVRACPMTVSFI